MSQTTEQQIAAYIDANVEARRREMETFLGLCESPIERLFVAVVLCVGSLQHYDTETGQVPCWRCPTYGNEAWCIIPQFRTETEEGAHRLDFALLFRGARVNVECDGFDYHDRTKEDAARDKSRDRALTAAGWTVLRFTGSEIWSNAWACLTQALRILEEKARVAK